MNAHTRRVVGACLSLLASLPNGIGSGVVTGAIESFEASRLGGHNAEAISHWRWTKEEKLGAKAFSRLEIREGEGGGGRALSVSVFQPLPKGADFYALWTTGLDDLPPDASAVRMRVRVVSGRFSLTVGSATAYFANSDVWARPQVLEAGPWKTIEFSLVEDLQRNFRRAIFSAEAPAIHYTRWIQEPMRVMLGADSRGELWIDDIELVRTGGEAASAGPLGGEVDVLGAADLAGAFTFSTDDKEFDLARTPGREALRKPAELDLPEGPGRPLLARQRGLEEMSFIGIPMTFPEGANALRVTLKVSHQSRLDQVVVDFLALVSPDGTFPWVRAEAGGTKGFDFCLSPARTAGVSWGFYHARRIVPNGKPVALVIPLGDFLCAYGAGALRQRHQGQQPLSGSEVAAIALVSPFRQAAADTIFSIESIEAVRLKD